MLLNDGFSPMLKINRLKYFRIRNNITQKELAKLIGCTQVTISNIERRHYPTAKYHVLNRLNEIGLIGRPFDDVEFNKAEVGLLNSKVN